MALSCTGTDGSPLGWGTWLGADWKHGEGEYKFCMHIMWAVLIVYVLHQFILLILYL